jgi:hypothetical protein
MPLTLLDYGNPNPFGEVIGQTRQLAWPVNAYRVTLPKQSGQGDGLNPFERVILQLLDAVGKMHEDALADETRIPLDFVKGILLRLRDKGFIDQHNAIQREKFKDESEKALTFATALLFRECATGKILPFLHFLDESNPLRKRDEEKFKKIKDDKNFDTSIPSTKDVIVTLRKMKKRNLELGRDEPLPSVQQITIAETPESYFLYCPIAIQKHHGEYRIADPFGNGFSLLLENSFARILEQNTQLSDWLLEWKSSLENRRQDSPKALQKEPFETEANWQRYPNLLANLRPSRNSAFRSIIKIHNSIEWALFYACSKRSFVKAINELKFTPQTDHPALLEKVAQSIGLEPPKKSFRAVPEGKLTGFQDGKAELGTVLPIAILQAKDDKVHPMRRIASLHPDFIAQLFVIKGQRDEKRHGKGRADSSHAELPADRFMREIVHELVPDVRFADTPVPATDMEIRTDSILEARTNIQEEFGFRSYNQLGVNLQDRLTHVESFWLSAQDGSDALTFVNDLYAALQSIFSQRLSVTPPPDLKDSEFIDTAIKRAEKCGLGTLPKGLSTVKPSNVRQTLQGFDQSLGACAIAFLLLNDEDTLHSIAELQQNFLLSISEVTNASGHGNQPIPMNKTDIDELRKAAYSTIKTLLEI